MDGLGLATYDGNVRRGHHTRRTHLRAHAITLSVVSGHLGHHLTQFLNEVGVGRRNVRADHLALRRIVGHAKRLTLLVALLMRMATLRGISHGLICALGIDYGVPTLQVLGLTFVYGRLLFVTTTALSGDLLGDLQRFNGRLDVPCGVHATGGGLR